MNCKYHTNGDYKCDIIESFPTFRTNTKGRGGYREGEIYGIKKYRLKDINDYIHLSGYCKSNYEYAANNKYRSRAQIDNYCADKNMSIACDRMFPDNCFCTGKDLVKVTGNNSDLCNKWKMNNPDIAILIGRDIANWNTDYPKKSLLVTKKGNLQNYKGMTQAKEGTILVTSGTDTCGLQWTNGTGEGGKGLEANKRLQAKFDCDNGGDLVKIEKTGNDYKMKSKDGYTYGLAWNGGDTGLNAQGELMLGDYDRNALWIKNGGDKFEITNDGKIKSGDCYLEASAIKGLFGRESNVGVDEHIAKWNCDTNLSVDKKGSYFTFTPSTPIKVVSQPHDSTRRSFIPTSGRGSKRPAPKLAPTLAPPTLAPSTPAPLAWKKQGKDNDGYCEKGTTYITGYSVNNLDQCKDKCISTNNCNFISYAQHKKSGHKGCALYSGTSCTATGPSSMCISGKFANTCHTSYKKPSTGSNTWVKQGEDNDGYCKKGTTYITGYSVNNLDQCKNKCISTNNCNFISYADSKHKKSGHKGCALYSGTSCTASGSSSSCKDTCHTSYKKTIKY